MNYIFLKIKIKIKNKIENYGINIIKNIILI